MQGYITLDEVPTFMQFIFISLARQKLFCYKQDKPYKIFTISSAKNGAGELSGSECTPRGWHRIYSRIGMDAPLNTVFKGRKPTGEIFSTELAEQFPGRDWILTRIIQLEGVETGRNKGGNVDSLERYIYIHGTPDTTDMTEPASHGCIRMQNHDMIEFSEWVRPGTYACIE